MAEQQLPEIPKDITPQDFFTKFIPEQFAARKDEMPDEAKDVEAAIQFTLSGDGGGEWTLQFKGGDLTVDEGAKGKPIIRIRQTAKDFKDMLSGERGGFVGESLLGGGDDDGAEGGMGGMLGGGGQGALTPDAISRLEETQGTLQFKIADADKGDWVLEVQFGEGDPPDEPDAAIVLQAEDVEAIQSGELNPQEAFMSGKIMIEGDMGLVMQMGTSMMAQ